MNPKRHSESLGNYGNNFASFSANGFVLPKSVRLSPDFQNDRPEFWWGERPREPRRPDFETASPNFRAVPPISKATVPFLKTTLPVSADAPPDLKAAPPIFGESPRFCQPFPRFFGRQNAFGNLFPAAIYTVFNPKLTKN
jgi:hypothetical protein